MPGAFPANGYVLDTNVLVHLIRGKEIGRAINREFDVEANLSRCLVSAVSIGEISSLALRGGWGEKRHELIETILQQVVVADIGNAETFKAYAEIDGFSLDAGRPMGKNDVWIAALAKVANAPLLTCDKDFDHLHPALINRIRLHAETGEVETD